MSHTPHGRDEVLVQRLLRGDESAFRQVYEACSAPVYRFALYMTSDTQLAQEITQDTFLFLLAQASCYQPDRGSLLSWLLGVARNHSRRALGLLSETEPLDHSLQQEPAAEFDLVADLTRREVIESVRRAVASLPAALREVVILCDLQELEYQEAATILACPVGTVRSRLHRARGLLVSKLQAECFTC